MHSTCNRRRVSSFVIASILLLGVALPATSAGKARPFEVNFNKCFDRAGDAPYLFTFAGTAWGDVSGTLEARVSVHIPGVEPNQTHIQADYVVAGSLSFTARVGGRINDRTKRAVLRGFVSEGPAWLVGAGVHDEFRDYVRADGTPCSRGTLYVTPRWTQSHNDD
jgi:hypothetical protein